MSQRSRDAIQSVLRRHYEHVNVTLVDSLSDLEALAARKPDLVFLGMMYLPTDNSAVTRPKNRLWLSDFLDHHGIVYTGSTRVAHELELNKDLAKQRVCDAGLETSPFYVAEQGYTGAKMPLTYPVFIKPISRGGGVGIDAASLAHTIEELLLKVQSIATDLDSDALVEQYLPGREFSVAILKNEFDDYDAMPIELAAPENLSSGKALSQAVKSLNLEVVLPVTNPEIRSRVTALALNVFKALGGRDYGRIDIRLDEFGSPHFLEANLIPSLIAGYGSFPKACLLNAQIDQEAMLLRIVHLGLARASNWADVEISQEPPLNTSYPVAHLVQ